MTNGSLSTPKYFNIGFIGTASCVKKSAVDVVDCTSDNLPAAAIVILPAANQVFVAGAGRWKAADELESDKSFTIDNNRVILDKQ